MKKRNVKKAYLLMFIISITIFSLNFISAQTGDFTYIISNSENWKDVYSIMHYAQIKGVGSDFLVSTKHGSLLLNGINKNNDIRVISSRKSAFVINYDDMIRNEGFSGADEVLVDDANLELIEELPEIKNFIIVGDTYGYNAIAVAPYASLTNSWVFMASKTNIDEIETLLNSRSVNNVLIYGFVDKEVKDALQKYNPQIIDNGDRFKDNVEIVKKYIEIKPTKQIILSNGEFIEKEIMSGTSPVLFTGKENVPDQIRDYIKNSDIEVGVLIGADLVGAATNIRRSTGISVIVKFARGARAPTGAIAAVEGLDLFYLPTPIIGLELYSAKYNRATSQLEITYKSNSNIPIFFKGTITPKTSSGDNTRIGDVDPIFIAPNDFKTIAYTNLEFSEEKFSIDVFTLYGDTPTSLEKILEKSVDVEIVNILDRCKIDVKGVKYSKPKESFVVKIENLAETECWVDVELSNVIINNKKETLGSEGSIKIASRKKKNIFVKKTMDDDDLRKNSFVDVISYYGEREDSLVNILKGRFELNIETISFATIGLIALALITIIAIIILVVIFIKRKRDNYW